MRRRQVRRWIVQTMATGGALAAVWVGWFSAPREWRVATGWRRIPPGLRPTAERLWDHGGPAPEVRWLGHSGFVVDWYGRRLVLDPNLSPWCTVARRLLATPASAADLGRVDAALISHAHYDHLDLPTLAAIPHLERVVVPEGSGRYLAGELADATAVAELTLDGSVRIGPLEVFAVPAVHNGNRFHPLASKELAVGYVIRSPTTSIYYAGDTGFGDHFAAIARTFRPRAAILPIGAYAPRFPLAAYHLNPEEAVAAARALGVETVVPCHFGTYTLALDRPSWALPRFARAAHAADLRWLMPRLAGEASDDPVTSGARVAAADL